MRRFYREDLFTVLARTARVPPDLARALAALLPEPVKDGTAAGACPPIAPLSAVMKLLERLTLSRVLDRLPSPSGRDVVPRAGGSRGKTRSRGRLAFQPFRGEL